MGVFLSILAGGASVSAVVDQHLGRPIDVWGCYKRAWNRVLSLVVVFLVVSLALSGSAILMIIIVGIPLFFWLLVVWFYATEAIIIEGEDPISALGRSYGLVKGTWWRVFGIGVVFVLVLITLSIVGGIPALVVASINPVTGALLSAVVSSLILPVFLIGRTLVYFDLRARKERYTLEVLASEVGR